jgi:pilus assembly protein FimV
MLRRLSLFVFAALAVSLPASALDLDRIELKSGIGQPLLAEIPVVSADASELQRLQARLASPATFARIGLERPRGVVASLQFRLVRDARGKPVIRVTSTAPVERDFLTFLVQVDWGEGRMVREYSLSLSAPDTLASSMPQRIEAPRTAMSNTIARAAEPVAIALATDALPTDAIAPDVVDAQAAPIPLATSAAAPAAEPGSKAVPGQDMRDPGRLEQKPKPAAVKPVAPATQPAPANQREAGQGGARGAGDYGPIRAGDTLSEIAGTFVDDRHTLNQAMLALLRVNPEAFIAGNINLLRRGAILRAPQPAELSRYSAAEATAMVHEQIRSWREGRPVPPQPAALPPAATPGADTALATEAPRVVAPRLEISPGPADALPQKPGAAAGAGLDGPQASIAGTGESRVARDAELMELRARVSELDELQQQQQALLALRNKELAARPASRAGAWPWLAAAFAVLMPVAWWLGRRGKRTGHSSGGHRGQAGVSADAGWDDVDETEPTQTIESESPTSTSPAWHPTMRKTASVATDA